MYIVLLSIVKPAWEHERSDWKAPAQMWVWNCGPWGGRLVDRADWQFWHHCGHSQLILATSLTLVSQFRFTKKMYILVSHPHSEIILQTLLHYGDHMFSLKKKKKKNQLYWRVPFSEHKIHSFTFLSMLLHMLTEVCSHHYSLIIFFSHQRNFLLTSRRF